MVYISAWDTVALNPQLKLFSLLKPNLYTPTAVPFIGLVSIYVPDQAPFVVWVEPILPFTYVRELNHEWFVVYKPQKHPVRPHLYDEFLPYILRFFGVTKVSGFRSPLLGAH